MPNEHQHNWKFNGGNPRCFDVLPNGETCGESKWWYDLKNKPLDLTPITKDLTKSS